MYSVQLPVNTQYASSDPAVPAINNVILFFHSRNHKRK